MAPVSNGRSRRRFGDRYDDSFYDQPWDPFWEYVLGDGEGVETQRSRSFFQQQQPERSDSFLEYLFPEGNDKGKKGTKKKVASTSALTAANSSKRNGFWRQKEGNPSSNASWFDESRNEHSTTRGSEGKGFFNRSKPKSDPLGLVAAKGSFDSFIEHYYGSDVETSEEEVVSAVQQKERPNIKKRLPKSSKRGKQTGSFLDQLSWESGTAKKKKKKKSRRLFARKSNKDKSTSPPLSSLFSQQGNNVTSSSSSPFAGFIKPSASNGASLASSNRSARKDLGLQSERDHRNISPLERFVETFDAFGDVTSSDDEDEFSTSVSSDDAEDDDDDDDEDEGSSSYESSYASASNSYATEITDEDTNCTSNPSENSKFRFGNSNATQRVVLGSRSPGSAQRSNRTVVENKSNLNEVRLKHTPSRSPKTLEPASPRRLLPPLNRDDDDSDAESEPLAGESVGSRSVADSTDCSYNEELVEEREDNPSISTKESLRPDKRSVNSVTEATGSVLPSVLPKSVANSGKLQVQDDESALEQSRLLLARNQSLVGKVVCCSVKDLTPAQQDRCRELGVAVHELTREELEEIFPKVRSISEDVPLSRHRSCVIGNSKSFEKDFPAHLQAIVKQNGPQSLYEYEYEKGTHKVLVYEEFGSDPRSSLRVHISDRPPVLFREGFLDDDKVIVQVEASTVSPTDCLIRQGRWAGFGGIPLPNSPGVDVVGKVYSIGEQAVKKFGIDVGHRVMALTQYGGNARYLAVNAGQFVKVPENVDPAEAACLTEAYLTAFQALHHGQSYSVRYRKTSLKGKQLLILGTISSNMGRALSQLSSAASVDNLYATSKQKHYQRLTSLGILPLSMDPLHWFDRLKGKVDLIIAFDEEITPLHFKTLSPTGEALLVSSDGSNPMTKTDPVLRATGKLACRRHGWQNRSRVNSYNVFTEWETNLDKCKKDLEHLVRLLSERWVVPEVLDRIPLNKVPRAQELVETKNIPGFIVCEPWIISKSRAVLL